MENFALINIPHQEKIALLKSSEWGSNLAPIQIDQLAKYLTAYSVPPGITLLTEGEQNTMLFIICSGSVNIMHDQEKVTTLGKGKVVGEMSFFDEEPCSASVVVNQNVTLLVMDNKTFIELTAHLPQVAVKICLNLIKYLSNRLRNPSLAVKDY